MRSRTGAVLEGPDELGGDELAPQRHRLAPRPGARGRGPAEVAGAVNRARRIMGSFDESVRAEPERVGNRKAEGLCGPEVDDELEARRLLDGQGSRPSAFEDPVDEERRAPIEIALLCAAGHEPAHVSESAD